MSVFAHLHNHTPYSMLRGNCRIKTLVAQAKELGQTAIAITDNGNLFGVIEFFCECKKQGIKPIIGCELYVAVRTMHDREAGIDDHRYHLVLLAKNEIGYHNLIRIVSLACTEGLYIKPRCDFSVLERHHEGLIAMSTYMDGEISKRLSGGDQTGAMETALKYKRVFGADYYLEIQDHGHSEEKELMDSLRKLADASGVKIVASNNVHYVSKSDAFTQNILMCISQGKRMADAEPSAPRTEYYLKTEAEMMSRFPEHPEYISTTQEIADKCNVTLPFGIYHFPDYCNGTGEPIEKQIARLATKGLIRRYGETEAERLYPRLIHELTIIQNAGFTPCFLAMWDFIVSVKKRGVPIGAGRGSAAGVLVSYCLGITSVDPIKYELLFELCINPEHVEMPSIAIDFLSENRQAVMDFVVEKYGAGHVAKIGSVSYLDGAQAVREVARVTGKRFALGDKIARLIGTDQTTIRNALKNNPSIKELYNADREARYIIETAMKIEGVPRQASSTEAGIVITAQPIIEHIPIAQYGEMENDVPATQYTRTTLKKLGLFELEFIEIPNIQNVKGYEAVTDDDPAVFQMLARGETSGVFQLEGAATRTTLMQLQPTSLEHLAAVVALHRANRMNTLSTYIHIRHNPQEITYKHPLLEPILGSTNGCIIYVEQIIQMAYDLSGCSYAHAELVWRTYMTEKNEVVLSQEREYFLHGKKTDDGELAWCGAVANGVPEELAMDLFDEMAVCTDFVMSKAHAISYAAISYQTAYMRHYNSSQHSGHPLAQYDNLVASRITAHICELAEKGHNEQISVAGIVTKIQAKPTRAKGREMAYVEVEDITGSIGCILLPATYEKAKSQLKGAAPVLFHGRISITHDDGMKILVDEMECLE